METCLRKILTCGVQSDIVRFPLGSGINGNSVVNVGQHPGSFLYASLWEAELMETQEFFIYFPGLSPVRFPLGSGINGNQKL